MLTSLGFKKNSEIETDNDEKIMRRSSMIVEDLKGIENICK
jgi:hypothetical protein